jgi:hypothetical protein
LGTFVSGVVFNSWKAGYFASFKTFGFQAFLSVSRNMAFGKRVCSGLDLVLRFGHCAVWHYGFEGRVKVEGTLTMKISLIDRFTDFGKGVLVGFLLSALVVGVVVGVIIHRNKVKEIVEYAEKQIELLELQEDFINRDPVEFFEVPGVRGAADNAAAEFERRRDEALDRFRNRLTD